jgi:hypothetical protein
VEGFVTREGGDSLDVRNVAGQVVTLEKATSRSEAGTSSHDAGRADEWLHPG